MKQYYGNYLGIVINGGEKDPEGRGRCQVFIPHIMPSLYEGWNKEGEDINFEIIGDGLPTALNSDIVERLTKILPWAECAAPIVGSSPSVKNGSEEIRNRGGTSTKEGVSISDISIALGGSDDDNAKFAALTTEAAKNTFSVNKCGTAVGEILESVFGYSENQVRAGSSTGRRDGKEYTDILQSLGWKPIKVSSPSAAPANSVLTYDGVPGNSSSAGRQYGHVEYVGINPNGQKAYYYGLGGANGASRPAGGCLPGWTGVAWVPPADVTNSALNRLGLPSINPSGIAGGANPVDTNMKPDPTQETGQYGGSAIAENKFSDNEILFAMRIAAGESGAGVNNPESVYNAITNVEQRVGHSYDPASQLGSSYSESEVEEYGRSLINSGKVDWSRVDIGYVQSNQYNNTQGGVNANAGSYKQQILGTAQLVRSLSQKNPTLGQQVLNSIESGNFAVADRILGSKNREETIGTKYFALRDQPGQTKELENRIKNEFNGDVKAALNAIDSELDETPDIAQLSSGEFTPQNIASSPIIRNPTKHGRADGSNTNYQALGMFGYASEGTAVWVFFREGNPLFPVYFAASYGQREWANMYSYNSPGIGAGVGGKGAIPNTEKMRMNSYGGGFESAQVSEDPESGLEPEFNFQVYGKNGSNLLFTKDHTEFNSTYNHNQRVSGDFHEITEANKETRVRGDKNTYVEQDVYITIGNWSDEAIAACDEIQGYINEAMDVMSAAGDSGSTTAGTSTQEPISIDEAKERARAQQDEFVRQRQEIDRLQAKIDKLPPSEQAQAQENLNETIRLLSNKVAAATP